MPVRGKFEGDESFPCLGELYVGSRQGQDRDKDQRVSKVLRVIWPKHQTAVLHPARGCAFAIGRHTWILTRTQGDPEEWFLYVIRVGLTHRGRLKSCNPCPLSMNGGCTCIFWIFVLTDNQIGVEMHRDGINPSIYSYF